MDDRLRPAEIRTLQAPRLVAALKKFLPPDSFAVLDELRESYGCPIEMQIAGALGSWIEYVRRHRARHDGFTIEFIAREINEFLCVLTPDELGYSLENRRVEKSTPEGAGLFLDIVQRAQRGPFAEAVPILKGLLDLVNGNPAYTGEAKYIREWMDAGECIGSAQLYARAGIPLP